MMYANATVRNYDMAAVVGQRDGQVAWALYDMKAKKSQFRYLHEAQDLSAITGITDVKLSEVAMMDYAVEVLGQCILRAESEGNVHNIMLILPERNAIRGFELVTKAKGAESWDELKSMLYKDWMKPAWRASLDALVDAVAYAQERGINVGFESRRGLRHIRIVPSGKKIVDNIEDGQELLVQNGKIKGNEDWLVDNPYVTGMFIAEVRRSTDRNGKEHVSRSVSRYREDQLKVQYKWTVNGDDLEIKLPNNARWANLWILDATLSHVLPQMQIGGGFEAVDVPEQNEDDGEEQMQIGGSFE